jgi:hypothetical protein
VDSFSNHKFRVENKGDNNKSQIQKERFLSKMVLSLFQKIVPIFKSIQAQLNFDHWSKYPQFTYNTVRYDYIRCGIDILCGVQRSENIPK